MLPTEREINERLRTIEHDARNRSADPVDSLAVRDGSARRGMVKNRLQQIRRLLLLLRPATPRQASSRKIFVE